MPAEAGPDMNRPEVNGPEANQSELKNLLFWSGHIVRNAPGLGLKAGAIALSRHTLSPPDKTKMLIGTHHKVLTVFLGRVFRVFGRLTNRSATSGMGDALDYSRDILLDHHSKFAFDALPSEWRGLHVVRDPRDLLVSAANYHCKSSESWLHDPMEEFGGKTYQEQINSLPDLEARLLFEIDNAAGLEITDMLDWNYDQPQMAEARYDDLVGPEASANFRAAITPWNLAKGDHDLLVALFDYFSIGSPGASGNKHIRNAASGQWRKHFTPSVSAHFNKIFPNAAEKLGYGDSASPASNS